jgi:pullulanase/glycogen debranching enzyme
VNDLLSEKEVHDYAEKIAERGCANVNRLLQEIEDGTEVPEIAHLDEHQQRQVLVELKIVMAVYDRCAVIPE